jgi:hypothetical protein
MRDLAVGVLPAAERPIPEMGINRNVHFTMSDTEPFSSCDLSNDQNLWMVLGG